nr:MAG: nonstructural protein [Microviridae sp.]
MVGQVFSILDLKASAFSQPFVSAGKGTALRSFEQLVNDGKSLVCQYPGDFTLMHLGAFDDSTGTFINLSAPSIVCSASELKRPSIGPLAVPPVSGVEEYAHH